MTLHRSFFHSLPLQLLLAGALTSLTSCSVGHRPMRPASPDSTAALEMKYEITSTRGKQFGCSFIEFDQQGDFFSVENNNGKSIPAGQHEAAFRRVRELAQRDDKTLFLVIYCHGWNHNSQGKNVLDFNRFLGSLANLPEHRHHRVHGVYLSWQGKLLKPAYKTSFAKKVEADFFGSEQIVDRGERWPLPPTPLHTVNPLSWVSYWSRKRTAEDRVSGSPISRSIFEIAGIARKTQKNSKIILMGHSFGALVLERSIGESAVGYLQNDITAPPGTRSNWPFDMVLLLNSAAPSLYSKYIQDGLRSYTDTYENRTGKVWRKPLVISATSRNDYATKGLHFVANSFTPFSADMQRGYEEYPGRPRSSYFYRRTPGHNKLLLTKEVVRTQPSENQTEEKFLAGLSKNLQQAGSTRKFSTQRGTRVDYWQLQDSPHLKTETATGAFWNISVPKQIISGHGGVWTDSAIGFYTALLAMSTES